MPKPDESFWGDPPWGDGKQKYRLGLSPISQEEWLNRKIGDSLYKPVSYTHLTQPTNREV